MNKKITRREIPGGFFDIQMVYVVTSLEVHSYHDITSGVVTRNDESFSDIVDRHLEEYSEAWQELAKM